MTTCANPDHSELEYCYTTAVYPCSYIDGQTARSQVAAPREVIDATVYNALIQQGFRRSGPFVYRSRCDLCQACQSMRLNVRNFVANRSQKRAWLKHAGLKATVMAPSFRDGHYLLYSRYQEARHADGGMDLDDVGQYVDFLVCTNVASMMVEFRQPLPGNDLGELKMVSIIDQLDDGLSAVYTFFESEPGQSFGTFNVLWQVRLAQTLGLKHLYLGYWIEKCGKMSYKTRFKPYELFINGKWDGA